MEGHGTARLARVLCGVHLRLVLLPRKRVLRLSSLFIGKMKEERPVINSTDKARLSPLFLKSSSSSLALVSWGLMGNICLSEKMSGQSNHTFRWGGLKSFGNSCVSF